MPAITAIKATRRDPQRVTIHVDGKFAATVSVKSDDQYALSTLGSILTGSRTARLTKELVYDRQIAASVSAA